MCSGLRTSMSGCAPNAPVIGGPYCKIRKRCSPFCPNGLSPFSLPPPHSPFPGAQSAARPRIYTMPVALHSRRVVEYRERQTHPKSPPHKPTPHNLVSLDCAGTPGEVLSLPWQVPSCRGRVTHPTHSRVVSIRSVSVQPICLWYRGMCGGPE